jgi:hypothetical protein
VGTGEPKENELQWPITHSLPEKHVQKYFTCTDQREVRWVEYSFNRLVLHLCLIAYKRQLTYVLFIVQLKGPSPDTEQTIVSSAFNMSKIASKA